MDRFGNRRARGIGNHADAALKARSPCLGEGGRGDGSYLLLRKIQMKPSAVTSSPHTPKAMNSLATCSCVTWC